MKITRATILILITCGCIAVGTVHGGWNSIGPYGGHVLSVAIDPQTPITLWVTATDPGAVFKSLDGGASWFAIDIGIDDLGDTVLTIDPQTPSTLYLAVGGRGVLKSTDGGDTWFAVNNGLTDPGNPWAYVVVKRVVIDPQQPSNLYLIAKNHGIYRSQDGGASWFSLPIGVMNVRAIAIDPQTTTTLYTGTYQSGVYKSTDSGDSWFEVRNGLTDPNDPLSYLGINCLAVDPQTPTTLYAGTTARSIYKSTDGGASWFDVNSGLPPSQEFSDVHALCIDPITPTTLYAALWGGVFKSLDGGASWFPANTGLDDLRVTSLSIDHQTTTTLYAGSSCVGLSKSVDGGANWSISNTGFDGLQVTALAIDPQTTTILYAGSSCVGVLKSTDSGARWIAVNNGLSNPDDPTEYVRVKCLAIDDQTPTTLYIGTYQYGVYKSTDGGTSWSAVNTGLPIDYSVTSLTVDPSSPTTLYAQTETTIPAHPKPLNVTNSYKSTDGGDSWNKIPAPEWRYVYYFSFKRPLAIDPITTDTLYLGTGETVSKSLDGGASWFPVYDVAPNVTAIAIDPQTPAILYIGTGDGAYKSTDGGASWFAVSISQLVVSTLAIDFSIPTILYMGTSGNGVFRSQDGGASWIGFNTGLANLNVNAVSIDPSEPTILYAATEDGVFTIDADSIVENSGGGSGSGCFLSTMKK